MCNVFNGLLSLFFMCHVTVVLLLLFFALLSILIGLECGGKSVEYFDFRRNSHFVISLRLLLLVLCCSRLVGVGIFNFIFQSELNCFSLVRRANNINMRGREEEKVSMTNNNARMFNRIVKMLVSFSNSFTCEPRFDVEFESMQSFYASIKVFAVCIKFWLDSEVLVFAIAKQLWALIFLAIEFDFEMCPTTFSQQMINFQFLTSRGLVFETGTFSRHSRVERSEF